VLFRSEKPDALILHGFPSNKQAIPENIQSWLNANVPVWVIVGKQTDLSQVSNLIPSFKIQLLEDEWDLIRPYYKPEFNLFSLDEQNTSIMEDYPPIETPFAQVEVPANASILMLQKVGSVYSSKPLLVVTEKQESRGAILLGSGFWKWRIHEFAINQNHQLFDEWLTKLVQFLATREDRRKFKVYPVNTSFSSSEPIIFQAEAYNEIYEPIVGQSVTLTIRNAAGFNQSFDFITSSPNHRFNAGSLPAGVFNYTATTELAGQRVSDNGDFIVEQLQLENMDLTANFLLLRLLSQKSDGSFLPFEQRDLLLENLTENKPPSRIHADIQLSEIIDIKWLFFLLLLLISAEWFLRKYQGGY